MGAQTPLRRLGYWTLVAGVWALIFLVIFFAVFLRDLPDTSKLGKDDEQHSIQYLDISGARIGVRGSLQAPSMKLEALPKYVPDAFISIEDRWFYVHPGFNPWGILRSQVYNLTHRGGPLRGGSTITQQLARNLFLSPKQTYRRKLQELVLALWLELKFSKKEILELYLNRVDFGSGAVGIDAAAERYFNKSASKLTVGEAALLAGLVKGPSRYSPISNTERAARRARVVLSEMLQSRKITREQYDAASREKVRVSRTLASQNAGYFIAWIHAQIVETYGDPKEDLIVETTLDFPTQLAAEAAVRQVVKRDAKSKGVQQAALVALDGEGRVRAYVGGADFGESEFDRASSNQGRQAGSAFKPFVYLAAMNAGRTPNEMTVDESVTIKGWTPQNYTGKYLGPITLQTALAQSVNTVAAKLADEVGTGNVAATARSLGITAPIQTDPSMALGAVEVTPLQMAQAYAAFANGGRKTVGYGIERVRTASGKVLYDRSRQKPAQPQVIGSPSLQYMNQMMRQVIVSGTGTRARVGGYDIAGKTGTTSDYRDAWFVGYTGGFVAAVWVGKDDNTKMKSVTGGGAPAEIWRNFMDATLPRLKVQAIPGGVIAPPNPTADPIGALLNGVQNLVGGGDTPPAREPEPRPAPTPAPVQPPPPAAGGPSRPGQQLIPY